MAGRVTVQMLEVNKYDRAIASLLNMGKSQKAIERSVTKWAKKSWPDKTIAANTMRGIINRGRSANKAAKQLSRLGQGKRLPVTSIPKSASAINQYSYTVLTQLSAASGQGKWLTYELGSQHQLTHSEIIDAATKFYQDPTNAQLASARESERELMYASVISVNLIAVRRQ